MEKNNNFTQIQNDILHSILLNKFNQRELKILLLTARLTYGCHRKWVRFIFADLKIVGIKQSHAKEVIEQMLQKNILVRNNKTGEYRINEDFLIAEAGKKESLFAVLKTVIGKNLTHKTSQNGNSDVPFSGTEPFPKEELQPSLKGNKATFPNGEVSGSENSDFTQAKDNDIKDNKKSDKESIADYKIVNPKNFSPSNEDEYSALEAWKRVEPNNPASFNFYLKAVKRGFPSSLFFQFASEIEQDPSIENKGRVLNAKVTEYMKEKGIYWKD